MTFDFSSLEPEIRQILSAPGTDLSTISAKRVRRQLLTLDPSLTPEFLKEHKDAVDEVIARVFGEVSNVEQEEETAETPEPSHAATKPSKSPKRGSNNAGNADDDEPEDYPRPAKKSKKSSKSQELTDAELARRLSSEINGRNTRTGGKPPKKTSRVKKSAAVADSDASDDGSEKHVRKAKGGFAKEYVLRSVLFEILRPPRTDACFSGALSTVLQVDKLSRPQVVKQLWVYIKDNELQNPSNKREIMCDPKLKAVFGVEKIDMFRMNRVLGESVVLLLVPMPLSDASLDTYTNRRHEQVSQNVSTSVFNDPSHLYLPIASPCRFAFALYFCRYSSSLVGCAPIFIHPESPSTTVSECGLLLRYIRLGARAQSSWFCGRGKAVGVRNTLASSSAVTVGDDLSEAILKTVLWSSPALSTASILVEHKHQLLCIVNLPLLVDSNYGNELY